MKRIIAAAIAASSAQLVVSPAFAAIEEQIVTSQRRAENIQSVPVSVTAFGAGDLDRLGVNDPQALANFVPNASIGDGTGRSSSGAQFSIRGVNEARISPVLDPAVGVYIDDVYYGRPQTNFLKLLDVERVEVLRGPQGTLFGKNSTGGAIRYVTKRPDTDATHGQLKISAGNYDQRNVQGNFNLPLSDMAAFRLSAAHIENDGYVERLSDGVGLGSDDTDFINGQFRWTPADNVTVDFNLSYTDTSDNGGATKLIDYFGYNGSPDTGAPGSSPGASAIRAWNYQWAGTPLEYGPDIPSSLYEVAGEGRIGSTDTESTGAGLDISWELSDMLTLRSITGYRTVETLESRESDDQANAYTYFDDIKKEGSDFWSQEFQLNGISMDGRLNWVGGVFYSVEEPYAVELEDREGRVTGRYGALILNDNAQQETKSLGIYGQGDFMLTDRLTATLGLRYSRDDKNYTLFQTALWDHELDDLADEYDARLDLVAPSYGSCNPSVQASCISQSPISGGDTFNSLTPRVALEFQATDDVMMYAAASKGFKSGGTNDTVADITIPFSEEQIWSYEGGVRLQGENIRANLTAFFMDYTDKQLTVAGSDKCSNRCTLNAGDAEIRGLEAELLASLTDTLTLNLGIGTLDAKWTDPVPGSGVDLDTPFSRAPELSVNAGLRHDLMLANGASLTSSFNVGYKSEQQSSGQDSTTLTIPAYSIANARINYAPADANWSLALFCTNCFDKEYITGGAAWAGGTAGSGFNYKPDDHPAFVEPGAGSPLANAPPGITIVNVGAPLFWGVELTYDFGD